MGNQSMSINLLHQDIAINNSESKNLQIYRWRASSSCNKHISRVILQPKPDHLNNSICSVGIQQTSLLKNYQLFFQSYVCSFQNIKSSLNLQDSIYVFEALLYGYESIYNKFGKVVINPNCIFLTGKGEVRVWINPNYYLNDVWKSENKFTDFQKCHIQKLKTKIPKFTKSKKIQENYIFYQPSVILQKTIQLVKTFVCSQGQNLKLFSFLQSKSLQNFNFSKLHQFINQFLSENNLIKKNCLNQLPILKQKNNLSSKQLKSYNSLQRESQVMHNKFSQLLPKNIFDHNKQNGKTSILMTKIQRMNKQLKKTINLSQTQRFKNSFTNDSTLKQSTEGPSLKKFNNNSHQNMSLNDFNYKRFSGDKDQCVCLSNSNAQDLKRSIFEQFLDNNSKIPQKTKCQILPQYSMNINSFGIKNQNEVQQPLKSSILKKTKIKNRYHSFSHSPDQNNQNLQRSKKKMTLNFTPTIVEWQRSKESSQLQNKNYPKHQKRQQLQMRKKRSSQHSLQQAFLSHLKKQQDQIIQETCRKCEGSKCNSKGKSENNLIYFDDLGQNNIIIRPKSPNINGNSISKSQFAIMRTQNNLYNGQQWLRVSENNKYNGNFRKDQENSSYNSRNQPVVRTIRTLFSGNGSEKYCSSIGSMSSESQNNNSNSYSGILTKMGRSVVVQKDKNNDATAFLFTARNFQISNRSNKQNQNSRQKLNKSLKI